MGRKLFLTIILAFQLMVGSGQYLVKPDGTGNGKTWQNATNLQYALSSAQAGVEIWVAEGVHYPTSCSPCSEEDRKKSFIIPDGVKLLGGFKGNESNKSQRDWQQNKTILSGDIDQDNTKDNNSYSVVFTENVGSLTVADGLIIKDGYSDGLTSFKEDPTRSGGGWYNGGIGTPQSNPQIINCIFENNDANAFGGAMYNMGGFNGQCMPTYQNCIFRNNQTKFDGGAIYSNGSFGGDCNFVMEDCLFENNLAGWEIGSGGALFNNGIEGICNPEIRRCKFQYQEATLHGGAVYNQGKNGDASPLFENCTFYKNKAEQAGAIYNLGVRSNGNSSPQIINCTFYGNVAYDFGGAIMANGDLNGTSEPFIGNCIFWNNRGFIEGNVFYMVNGHPNMEYCLVENPSCLDMHTSLSNDSKITCGDGMIYNKPPKFRNPDIGDLRIKHNSAALNTGNILLCNANTDLDNIPRLHLENIDIGAHEYNGPAPTLYDSFNAETASDFVSLAWTTQTEYEMAGCEVQRSIDSIDFETVAWVPSQGNSQQSQTYQTWDVPPQRGEIYTYRLQCFDTDGCHQYFGLDTAFVLPNEILAKVYPIPTVDDVTLKVYFPRDNNGQNRLAVSLTNILGQTVIMEPEMMVSKGWAEFKYKLKDHASEIFYLHVLANRERFVIPILLSKL